MQRLIQALKSLLRPKLLPPDLDALWLLEVAEKQESFILADRYKRIAARLDNERRLARLYKYTSN